MLWQSGQALTIHCTCAFHFSHWECGFRFGFYRPSNLAVGNAQRAAVVADLLKRSDPEPIGSGSSQTAFLRVMTPLP
jgi:hypothetical protein